MAEIEKHDDELAWQIDSLKQSLARLPERAALLRQSIRILEEVKAADLPDD